MRVKVLKVPHHGAKSSLDVGWIEQVGTQTAVVSAGRHNAYGHPAAAVLTAYQNAGVQLFRTDRDGGVWVTGRLSSPDLQFHATREARPRPVRIGPSILTSESQNLTRIWNQWSGS